MDVVHYVYNFSESLQHVSETRMMGWTTGEKINKPTETSQESSSALGQLSTDVAVCTLACAELADHCIPRCLEGL